jgi:hypothetical protein
VGRWGHGSYVGQREIVSRIEQRFSGAFGKRIRYAVTKIESLAVAAFSEFLERLIGRINMLLAESNHAHS